MDFPFTCTIEHPTSTTGHHSITYGDPVSSECNYFDMEEFDNTQNILRISAWLALPPETVIEPDARVTLDDGTQYKVSSNIQNIKRCSDYEIDYVRVILGLPMQGRAL